MAGWIESGENKRFRHQREDVHLPPEIILEILSRLPVESILRCRSVCKSWNNLKQDPFFINLQLSRANDQPKRIILLSIGATSALYLVDVEMNKVRMIPKLPYLLYAGGLRIMSSLDGWLCLASGTRTFLVLICNPVTAEYMILPDNEHEDSWSDVILCHQVCLGFDSSVKKYKVVRIYYYIDDDTGDESCRCEVITLGLVETNSWRDLSLPCRVLDHKDCLGPVFANGRMWWIMDKEHHNPGDRRFILHFDLTCETFGTVEFPRSIKAPVYRPDFPTCNLQLQIIGRYVVLMEYDGRSIDRWCDDGIRHRQE